MLYVTNPASQDPGEGSILGFAPNANGNVSPIVRIAGNRTRLGYDSASIAIDKLGRLYSTGTAHFQNDVYIWPPGSNGGTKPLTILSVSCGSISVYPMVLAFDRTGHLWVACSSDSGGELDEYPRLPPAVSENITPFFPPLRRIVGTREFKNFTSIALNSNAFVSVGEQFLHSIFTFGTKEHGVATPLFKLGGDKTQIDGKGGISYDSHGQLVVCTNRNNRPRLLTFAPGANGNVAPISILKVAGCKGVTLDSQDNVYVTSAKAITEYAAGAMGSATPIREISGDLTGLTNAGSIAF